VPKLNEILFNDQRRTFSEFGWSTTELFWQISAATNVNRTALYVNDAGNHRLFVLLEGKQEYD